MSGGADMEIGRYLLSIVVSLVVGLGGFILAYKIFDWLTPRLNFEDELLKNNLAVGIFLAGLFIGLGLLLGNAVK
jgi:putative membrane protein